MNFITFNSKIPFVYTRCRYHTNDNHTFQMISKQHKDVQIIKSARIFQSEFDKVSITKLVLLIIAWYTSTITLQLYNKWLFSPQHENFQFPLFTSFIYRIVQFVCLHVFIHYHSPQLKMKSYVSRIEYIRYFVPCGLTVGLDIGLCNSSLKNVSISFFTMIKSSSPIFILLFAYLFRLEYPSIPMICSMLIICWGVAYMMLSGTYFNFVGYVQIQLATVISGLRWSLTQFIIKNDLISMSNPLALNYYITPTVCICLLVSFLSMEGLSNLLHSPQFSTWQSFTTIMGSVTMGGLLALIMVNLELSLMKYTSAFTFSILGIFKEIVSIITAIMFFGDTLTVQMVQGFFITFVGLIVYNVSKQYQDKVTDDKIQTMEYP
ncbi:triose-phosphate transporter family-domain-containing protein [Globomyces pollinis-pini]|nr:triose-phosphate transporter family-domain-containing protein [Globomyces pollinis-pini]